MRVGEFVVGIGPSGCGKSTLLMMLAGLERPTTGRLLHNGRVIEGTDPDRSLIFQQPSLYPWLSTRDNVAFGLKLRGVARTERHRQADLFLRQVGPPVIAGQQPPQPSCGEQQPAAVARALCPWGDLLL